MEQKNDRIDEIRSDEVRDMLSDVPAWMIRWGNTLFFILFALLLALSIWVKYPDTVEGAVVLNTENPAIRMVAVTSGMVSNIYVKDGQLVQADDLLLEIKSPASQDKIKQLQGFLVEVQHYLRTGSVLVKPPLDSLSFGELQQDYVLLVKKLRDLQAHWGNTHYVQTLKYSQSQVQYQQKLAQIAQKQIEITQKESENASEQLHIYQNLLDREIISRQEWLNYATTYHERVKEVENQKKIFLQHQMQVVQIEQEAQKITFEYEEKLRMLKTEVQTQLAALENSAELWRQNYVFRAPVDGQVIFLKKLSAQQFLPAGQEPLAIIPEDEHIMAYAYVPAQGYGKIKPGQKVLIQLDNYPAYQYGHLNGVVAHKAEMPFSQEQGWVYKLDIELLHGMRSSHNYDFVYQPEMGGVARIVTEDLRLIERVFYSLRSLFDKQ